MVALSRCLLSQLLIVGRALGALVPNAYRAPQSLEQTTSVCDGRAANCEVLLDVPQVCIDSAGNSNCPVVFFLHGGGGTNDGFIGGSRVHGERAIGVYPQGEAGWYTGPPQRGSSCSWEDFDCTGDPNEGDFIARIISEVRARGALGSIYVFGTSNGAALAHRLAVNAGVELPIKGIVGMVTQLMATPPRSGPGHLNYNQPLPGGPKVSVRTILGTADPLVPYEGRNAPVYGGNQAFNLMSGTDSAQAWAEHNGCDLQPEVSTVTASLGDGTATFYEYAGCQGGTFVEHYGVNGAGHNAGGATLDGQRSMDATYEFIRKCESADPAPAPSPVEPSPAPSPVPSPVVPTPTPQPTLAPAPSCCKWSSGCGGSCASGWCSSDQSSCSGCGGHWCSDSSSLSASFERRLRRKSKASLKTE